MSKSPDTSNEENKVQILWEEVLQDHDEYLRVDKSHQMTFVNILLILKEVRTIGGQKNCNFDGKH